LLEPPFVTVITTVFSPSSQVALEPLVRESPFTVIDTPAFSSTAVAVIALVALEVSAVYAVVPAAKVGSSEMEPMVNADRFTFAPDTSEGIYTDWYQFWYTVLSVVFPVFAFTTPLARGVALMVSVSV
jgi:hypothetical protein